MSQISMSPDSQQLPAIDTVSPNGSFILFASTASCWPGITPPWGCLPCPVNCHVGSDPFDVLHHVDGVERGASVPTMERPGSSMRTGWGMPHLMAAPFKCRSDGGSQLLCADGLVGGL